jgi:hypothetical protein
VWLSVSQWGPLYTTLEGNLGTLQLTAIVTYDSGVYSYWYELYAEEIVSPVHVFDVGNVDQLQYWGAWNEGADYPFQDPQWQPGYTSVTWRFGELRNGSTARFGYYSEYGPDFVATTALDSGKNAEGYTYGMVIPEPALGSLAVGLLLGLGLLRRPRG